MPNREERLAARREAARYVTPLGDRIRDKIRLRFYQMVGVAFVILLIVFISSHTDPPNKPHAPAVTVTVPATPK
jgi:hypothetical protein